MTNKNASDQNTAETSPLAADVASSAISDTTQLNDQMDQLKVMVNSLALAFQASQTRNSQSAAFLEAASEIKQAARSMAVGAAATVYPVVTPSLPRECGGCGCGPCECVSDRCCMFDVTMTHVRVIDMQIEPVDSNAANMEVRMFASINGIGAVIPNLFSTLTLHKLINKPGVWSQVNQSIGRVEVCKGNPKTINISIDAVEVEDVVEVAAAALRDEYGTASVTMVLDCCCSVPSTVSVEVHFTGGGQGGGAIEAKFSATKICC